MLEPSSIASPHAIHGAIGRDALVDRLEAALLGPAGRVAVLHGAAGIGKTTIAAALADRAAARGFAVRWEHEAATGPRPPTTLPLLVVLDLEEQVPAVDRATWRRVLAQARPEDRVLVACRSVPDPLWALDPEVVAVGEPTAGDLAAQARALGMPARVASALAAWAAGSPLLVTLGAQHARGAPGWRPEPGDDPPELVDRLLRRLFGGAIPEMTATLVAAALGVALTAEDLGALGIDGPPASSVVVRIAEGYRLCPVAARAVRARAHRTAPGLERDVRRRLAAHLHTHGDRARATAALSVLAQRSPLSAAYRADDRLAARDALPGDAEVARRALRAAGHGSWWALTAPFVEQAPASVTVVCAPEGEPLAYAVALTPAHAPAIAADDPVAGPRLRHAEAVLRDGAAIVVRDSCDLLAPDPCGGVTPAQAAAHVAAIARGAVGDPRHVYLPIARPDAAAPILALLGARHLPELDAVVGGRTVECHLLDLGERGLLGAQLALVHAELGLRPAPPARFAADRRRLWKDAIRAYQRPAELAESPLASGGSRVERVASLRRAIDTAVAHCFGGAHDERLLHDVLRCAYLVPELGHKRAQYELGLSRTTYFRKLRVALARTLDELTA